MSLTPGRSKKAAPAEAVVEPAKDARRKEASPLRLAPLAERLPLMSETQLLAQKASAHRLSQDPGHPKHAAALRAVPLIDAEIRRRAGGPSNA
jgi:hypothetical protein